MPKIKGVRNLFLLTGTVAWDSFLSMGRALRVNLGGYVYHALNRANARLPLFTKDDDYSAFERVLTEACERFPMPLLGYCLMPNHWHLVLWPQQGKEKVSGTFSL